MAARSSLFFSSAGVLLSVISVLTAANLLYPTATIMMMIAVQDLLSGTVKSQQTSAGWAEAVGKLQFFFILRGEIDFQ